MTIFGKLTMALGLVGLALAGPVMGQATRTWVSGVGDDLNPCSRTAPCKTFAGAISKTATHGEINCLDPGAFGAVTIGKGISIICQYTEAGALATLGSNDITVNAPATEDVYLSGLDLHGANTGLTGVRFIAGASLTIENSIIRDFGAVNGLGVSFKPSAASTLVIRNTIVERNGSAATGGGILIQPTGAGGSARVTLQNVLVTNNANSGLRIDSTGNTSGNGILINVRNSVFDENANGMVIVSPGGTNPMSIMLTGSSVSNNSGTAINANGTGITMRVGDTTITQNAVGLTIAGGATINSFGTNRLFGNNPFGAPTNGTFTGAVVPQN